MPVVTDGDELQSYQTFDNQIGGHLKIKGVTCMVADSDGHLLKYVENSNVGRTEEAFYSSIFSHSHFLPLRKFVPHYFGTIVTEKDEDLLTYLKLENVIHGLHHPNIVDIKIGKVTHDPFATKQKIDKEYRKYPAQREIGFRLSGMKVFNFKTTSYDYYSRGLFRSCTCHGLAQEKTLKYLKHFMGIGDGLYNIKNDGESSPYQTCECCNILRRLAITHLVEHMIVDLNDMIKYMEKQTRIKFYASSLLITFDTAKLNSISHCTRHKMKSYIISLIPTKPHDVHESLVDHTCLKEQKTNDVNACEHEAGVNGKSKEKCFAGLTTRLSKSTHKPLCKNIHVPYSLKMIDFGHTYIDVIADRTVDTNYLFGLKNLLEYFKCILKEI